MKFSVISIFPQMIEEHLAHGVVGAAFREGKLELNTVNPRDFTQDVHHAVDDRPFGGGDGMVMMCEPLKKAFESLPDLKTAHVVYLSPQGQLLNHKKVLELSRHQHLVCLSGRYGGVDQRLLNEYVDEEISIGDYVLSGGELAALVVIDAVARQIPGVLGHGASAVSDSFSGQGLLESPQFTRPREWQGRQVPEALLSGNHAQIARYRELVSILVTLQKRPELLRRDGVMQSQVAEALDLYNKLGNDEKLALGLNDNLQTSWGGRK